VSSRSVQPDGSGTSLCQVLVFPCSRYSDGWTSVVRFLAGTIEFFLLLSVQTGSGAHQVSYLVGTGALLPEVKRPERENDHLPASVAEVKNS
jgi:hypothetical protein